MTGSYWIEFVILLVAAVLGGAAIIPYSLKLFSQRSKEKPLTMSTPKLVALSTLQSTIISAIAIGVGLLAAHAIGLGAPFIEAAITGGSEAGIAMMLAASISLGVIAGALLLFADLLFLPYLPKALVEVSLKTSIPDNLLASFYGGINEEFLLRLFGLSALLWLISRLWHTPAGLPSVAGFWIGNVVIAIVFALGHLPATKQILGSISRLILTRAILLNTPIGLLCGWLFWHYGIEAAVLAHFSADIIYHVFGTLLLRRKVSV